MRAFAKAFLIAGILSPCLSAQAALIHHWTGDNTPNDSVGGANAALRNGVSYASGKFAQAFKFTQASYDGSGNSQDSAEVINPLSPANANFGLTGAAGITISAYVTTDFSSTGDYQAYAGRPGTYQLGTYQSGVVLFGLLTGDSGFPIVSATTLPANTLTLVTGTYDAVTGDLKLYFDGVLQAATVYGGSNKSIAEAPYSFVIGGGTVAAAAVAPFYGTIDDVRVYDTALSPAQIADLIPEPASMALLALGGATMLGRRRK